jgi:hypothetical protein
MREKYYELIKKQGIQDTLSWVEDMPYSKKTIILEELISIYSVPIVNVALAQYEATYIKSHRIIPYMIRNILVNFCKIQTLEGRK